MEETIAVAIIVPILAFAAAYSLAALKGHK
jgi:hypothetical protein